MLQLNLTEEQAQELERTLIGRLDLDIDPKIKEEAARLAETGNSTRMSQLLYLKEINHQILENLHKLKFESNLF